VAGGLANRLIVQLLRRAPWLGEAWARHHRFVPEATVPWAPLRQPLARSTVALLTTAGVHRTSDPPFDMRDHDGDPSYRVIPSETPAEALTITHDYYDHSAADRDLNVVLPLDRLREAQQTGRIGAVAPRAYAFMGHVDGRHLVTLVERSAPEVARRLAADGADAVVLTPA